jgi:hypothetical protein
MRVFVSSSALAVFVALASWASPASVDARAQMYIKARTNGAVPTLGHFHPTRNPRYGAAVRAFGEPDSEHQRYTTLCNVRWASIGLTVHFANYGGEDACTHHGGLANDAVIAGPGARRWSTVPGLRVGNRVERLRRLYPAATRHGRSWWLVTATTHIACDAPEGCPYGVLRASMRHHRVDAFRVAIGAAGE